MSEAARRALERQFGAALEMTERAIGACPEAVWAAGPPWQRFWYVASHALWWTDYYLSGSPEGFRPPEPFGLEELDPAGVLPPRAYAPAELLAYAAHVRARMREVLGSLTDEGAAAPSAYPRQDFTVFERHLYNLRHLQHHAGQLQLLLRQGGAEPPRWVAASPPAGPGA